MCHAGKRNAVLVSKSGGVVKINMKSISFNIPPHVGAEESFIGQAIRNNKICGDGEFTKKCSLWMEQKFGAKKVLLTTSCTSALEMAALLCGTGPGDEVIMPSYTFCSTADAFVSRGCRIVFVDIRPDTMNIDESLIEQAITPKTKAIVAVHYAGVACEMDSIMAVARRHGLKVVEDAAQGVMAYYKGRALGTIGDFGCYSFHETKNYSMGEGGALLVNTDEHDVARAEIIREKGTNRSQFFRGQIDKYTWVDFGSSYLPSELNAAYLWPQLEAAEKINEFRIKVWLRYYNAFKDLQGRVGLPGIPEGCVHNAHMFYLKLKDLEERTEFIAYLRERKIGAVFHYIPLHSSPAGQKFGRFYGEDVHTTRESERLVRLPLYYGLGEDDQTEVIGEVRKFFARWGK